jgi:transposase
MELFDDQKQALKANLAVMDCIDAQVQQLERSIVTRLKLRDDCPALKTVSVGEILAMSIALEGAISVALPAPATSFRMPGW